MKIRSGFVSNSSASSFIINKKDISPELLQPIRDHYKIMCKTSAYIDAYDEWNIQETDEEIKGSTSMNNLDMRYFLEVVLEIPESKIKWDDRCQLF